MHAGLRELGVRGLVAIGGDGACASPTVFARRGSRSSASPRPSTTISAAPQATFGFDTAVTVRDRGDRPAALHRRSRTSASWSSRSWAATPAGSRMHAGVAGNAEVILIPEIPFSYESVCAKVREREAAGNASA